jgi:hypothetical protein
MRRTLLFPLLLLLSLTSYKVRAEELRIESKPPGATVEIDGKIVGITPYVSKKLPGGYFHKTTTVFGARLERPIHARLSLAGYVTQEVELTVGPMKWIALNGTYHGDYYLLKDKDISVALVAEAKAFAGTLTASSPATQVRLTSAEFSIEDLVDHSSSAVLKLSTPEASGSGFLVSSAGVVVTNAHVVGTNNEVVAKNLQQQQFNGKVVYRDPALDLALVQLDVQGARSRWPAGPDGTTRSRSARAPAPLPPVARTPARSTSCPLFLYEAAASPSITAKGGNHDYRPQPGKELRQGTTPLLDQVPPMVSYSAIGINRFTAVNFADCRAAAGSAGFSS